MGDPFDPRFIRDDVWNELFQRGWYERNGPQPNIEPSRDDDRSEAPDGQSLLDRLYERDPSLFVDHNPDQHREQDRGVDLDR